MSLKDLRVVETKPKGIVIATEGLQKSGKSEFGLSMPDPLYILDLNHGLQGIIEKHIKEGREIYVQDVQIPFTAALPGQAFVVLSTAATEQWRKAILSLMEAVKDDRINNIFIDTGGELWDLLRIARLGKLTQVLPIQYTAVNAEFRQLIQILLCSGKNVILSHKVKPEYVNDQKTGKFERAGFGDIGFDVQLELKAERDMKKEGVEQFSMTVLDCRAMPELRGKVFTGKDSKFLNIVKEVYPETTDADWK